MMKNSIKIAVLPLLTCLSVFLSIKLQGHGASYVYFIASFFILNSLLFFVFFTSYKNTIKLPANNYLIFLILFIIWMFLSCLWSPATNNSVKSALIFSLLPSAILIGFWSTLKQQQYFYSCLSILLLVITWKAGQQSLLSIPKLPAPGFFSNKNTNATFICMILLPICAQFLNTKINKNSQIMYGAALFIGAFVVSLTLSRGAVLGLCIGLLLLFIHTRIYKHPLMPFIKLASYLGTGYLAADLINKGANITILTNRTLTTSINTITSGRGSLWESGWQMYLDQPFLGHGLNMFHLLFPQYRQSPDVGQYVHNDYFQFLIELGPVGFLLFIAFIVTFLVSAKKLYQLSSNQDDKLFSLGLIAACISVLTHSLFTFNLYQPAPLLLLGLYIGILTQKLNLLSTENNYSIQLNKFITPIGYFSLLGILSLVFIYFSSITFISTKKTYSHYKNNLIALEEAETAHQLNSHDAAIIATQLNLYVDLLYNEKNKINTKGRTFLIDSGIKITKKAINANPFVHINYINTAKLYLLTTDQKHPDRVNVIKTAYRQAIKVNPFNLNSRIEYIKILMQLNEKQEAIEVFTGALGRKYFGNYKDPIYYLQLFLALISDSGDEKDIKNLKQQLDKLMTNKGARDYYTLNRLESN